MEPNSEHLIFSDTPPSKLHNLVVAYSGWPDAAEGATTAIKYLLRHLGAIKFAEIDPVDFSYFPKCFLEQVEQRTASGVSNGQLMISIIGIILNRML